MRRKNDSMKRLAIAAESSIGVREPCVATTWCNALMALNILPKIALMTTFVSRTSLDLKVSTPMFMPEIRMNELIKCKIIEIKMN